MHGLMVTAVPMSLCFAFKWLKKQTTLFAWRNFRFETGMWPWRHEKTMRLFCKTAKIDDAIICLWELEFVTISNSNGTIILIRVVIVHQCLHVVFLSVCHLFLLFSFLDKPKCFIQDSWQDLQFHKLCPSVLLRRSKRPSFWSEWAGGVQSTMATHGPMATVVFTVVPTSLC